MKIIIPLAFMLVLGFIAQAQVLTIKDQVTHLPLQMVIIQSQHPPLTTITDTKGQAEISAFQKADSIYIRFVGYESEAFTYAQLQEKQFKLFLTESNISLNAVVVSATRWQQEKKEVPNKILTIRSKEVLLQSPQTAADLLGQSGEVFIQKSQLGGGSPMIRGFATNRVLLTVDGVRMNTAIFRSGNLQNVISLDPFALKKTEVLFGPGSVIYGSDAIAGVMSFYTLTPTFSPGEQAQISGSAVGRWSSANTEKTGHFDFNIGLKKWAFVTSATYTDYDNLKMGSNGPEEYLRPSYVETINGHDETVPNPDPLVQISTGYNQLNLMQKVRFKPNNNWGFNYGFHYSTTSDTPRYDRLLRQKGENLRSAEWYYGPQVWIMNSLNVTHTAERKAYDKLSINLAQQFFKESRHDRDFGAATRFNRTEKVNALSANVDLEKAISKKHLLFYGAEAIYNKVNSTGNDEDILTGEVVPGPARYPDGADWSSYAAFLTYRYKASEKLSVQTGARYNYFLLNAAFDDTFYSFPFTSADIKAGALTGSAGLVYSPSPTLQLSTNLSTGFRSPNVDDVGKVFDSGPGSVVVPNPGLKPEYAYNVDVGIAKIFGNFLKLDVTAFYTYLDDALVRRNFTLNGQDSIIYDGEISQIQAIQNAAHANVWGVQAGIEAKLPMGFGISSRFNYQKGEEEVKDGTKAPLRHASPFFGATHLTYTRNRFKADLYAVYNSEVSNADLAPEEQGKDYMYAIDENGNPYSPAWTTLNLKALYRLTDYLMLSAGIENITAQRYRPYSSGIVAPGRNYILSVRASF
ncbi:TonB-dependent receptor plug domain-containing protein [Pontibacter silvestris]|uniref:TonB-dependent receptor plug domain-containing protein n=1 Tax=Pontibacter silvestris TaxID=2305183 RepID=A0ABW4WYC4_9BACT|nr:TonB-dependent receptor [Pontibacter silvestris]MCC9138431.1 TonB-dependent receptor [Pontibacter silvestris]